ncbi:FkbM family methyltransferase [Streptomyces sp. NPDC012888]|uniref:FkbM family methyltransferase n=1 Tax=Streptomyces sp. NPDC012888 TaxID=3364855 RepID=UPI00368C1A15
MNPHPTPLSVRDDHAVTSWHLALLGGAGTADLDGGFAELRSRAACPATSYAGPVAVHELGPGGGPYRGALLLSVEDPAGSTEIRPQGAATAADSGPEAGRPVAFMFPGLGDHYVGMGRGLYREFPVFREHLDRCAGLLAGELGFDVRDAVFAGEEDGREQAAPAEGLDLRQMLGRGGPQSEAEQRLNRTGVAQPALFAVEYALAKLWESWGVRPSVMIGYSLGEYVAATVAGVLTLEGAVKLVAQRARLIDASPEGAMLAVMLPEAEVVALLGGRLSLSAVNGSEFCVVAGPAEAVDELHTRLMADGVAARRVKSTHAFHSAMMEPLAAQVTALAATLELKPPAIPYVSNVTGRPITDEEATDPAYWARHLCSPVRFADGVAAIGAEPLLLETGPGQTLSSLAAESRGGDIGGIVASMRHPLESRADTAVLLKALGRLWTGRAEADWGAFGDSSVLTVSQDPHGTAGNAAGEGAGAVRDDDGLTDTQWRLRTIWARLLKNEALPLDVGFFELGGNSLLATRLILRVEREFGVELTLRRIYEAPTLLAMAAAVDALLGGGGDAVPASAQGWSAAAAGVRPAYRLPNGLMVHHLNEAETKHFYEDIFEHRTYAKNGITIEPGATVFDVGGNIGLFTLFAHYEAADVRVFTFEPAPPMFELISRNVAEHGVNAKLFNIGASDGETRAEFTFYPRSTGMSSFHPDEEEEKRNLRTIIANQRVHGGAEEGIESLDAYAEELMDVRFEAVPFEAVLRPLSAVIREEGVERIDLIKIDVQKSEQQVLDGIADEDWPKIRQMVLEVHDGDGRVAYLTRMLTARGFRVHAEQDEIYVGTDIHNIYALRGDQ